MKADLKLLIHEIVSEVVERWQQILQTQIAADPRRFTDRVASELHIDAGNAQQQHDSSLESAQIQRQKVLIRVAVEFCVELQDAYFLFYDLFLLFQDEKMDELFVDELEPFILAGRFREWSLPEDILANNIINFCKERRAPEMLEKIIVNLNFEHYPLKQKYELINYCSQKKLATAIIFLYTSVFENKDVTPLLTSSTNPASK